MTTMASWEERMAEKARLRRAAERDRNPVPEELGPTLAEVHASLSPPLDAQHCAHGIEYGKGGLQPLFAAGGAWAGGIAHCECCRSDYGYVDMAIYTGSGGGRLSAMDKHLCGDCGGEIRHLSGHDG